jgi:hypothetical protein
MLAVESLLTTKTDMSFPSFNTLDAELQTMLMASAAPKGKEEIDTMLAKDALEALVWLVRLASPEVKELKEAKEAVAIKEAVDSPLEVSLSVPPPPNPLVVLPPRVRLCTSHLCCG